MEDEKINLEDYTLKNESTRTSDEAIAKAQKELKELNEKRNQHILLTRENFKLREQEPDMSAIDQSIRDQLQYRFINDSLLALNLLIQQLNALEIIAFESLPKDKQDKVNRILDGEEMSDIEKTVAKKEEQIKKEMN